MIKKYKKSIFVNFLIGVFIYSSAFGMELSKDETKIYTPASLVEFSAKATVKKFLKMEPVEIQKDLNCLPEELDKVIVHHINRPVDKCGSTLLHRSTSEPKIARLLAIGANINCCNAFGDTVTLWYLKRNQLKNVLGLLKNVPCKVNHRNNYGVCALDLVGTIKDEKIRNEIKDLLIKLGAQQGVLKSTASHFSRLFSSRNPSASNELIEKTFQFYMNLAEIDDSMNYLHSLDEKTKIALQLYVNRPINQAGMTHLHCAKTESDVKKLLALKANIDAQTVAGETPLHTLIQRNYTKAAHALIRKGSPEYCNQDDKHHMTPICYAILTGSRSLVRALREKKSKSLLFFY